MAAVPTLSMYGTPAAGTSSRLSTPTSRPAPWSGIEYVSPREGKCGAKDDTCEGPRAKGTDFCIGHLRAVEKAAREQV